MHWHCPFLACKSEISREEGESKLDPSVSLVFGCQLEGVQGKRCTRRCGGRGRGLSIFYLHGMSVDSGLFLIEHSTLTSEMYSNATGRPAERSVERSVEHTPAGQPRSYPNEYSHAI